MSSAVGVFFYCYNTTRYLYLLRSDSNNWSIPGGKLNNEETILAGLTRECIEELDYFPDEVKLIPIQKFVNYNFTYHTFFCSVEEEFIPTLNNEHCGYAWVESKHYPKPLHPGLFSTMNIDIIQDKLELLTKKQP
jgi:8-oxo-dGTP pyrophosphatase MutT (NUDIX family)